MFSPSLEEIELDGTTHFQFLLGDLETQKAPNRSFSKINQIINTYVQSEKKEKAGKGG